MECISNAIFRQRIIDIRYRIEIDKVISKHHYTWLTGAWKTPRERMSRMSEVASDVYVFVECESWRITVRDWSLLGGSMTLAY